jgi:very-short-patch-repair endonuclease
MTPAEKVLWARLRGRRLHGLKFFRQDPIGPFIADFCCRDRRIIVELDGEVHESEQQRAYDEIRDTYLKSHSYVVLRFPNGQVLTDPDSVLKEISNTAHTAPPPWLRPRVQDKKKNLLNSPSPGEGGREGSGEGAGG